MATEIKVTASDGKIIHLDIEGDQPITANFQFKDIQDFKSNKGNHTFNFRIPSSRKNNRFFSFYYKVTQFGNFNPNKKSKCTILKDTIPVFDGYLQLTNVIKSSNGVSSYECVIFSSVASLGQVLKGKFLAEFDWSDLDHTKNLTNVTQSWDNLLHGGDVVYSLYDYGKSPMFGGDVEGSMTNSQDAYNINALVPQVRVKKMLDTILNQSGYTYESAFFNPSGISDGQKLYVDVNNGGDATNSVNADYYHVQMNGSVGLIRQDQRMLKIMGSTAVRNSAGLYNTTTGDYTFPSSSPFGLFQFGGDFVFETDESNNLSEVAPFTGADVTIALTYGEAGNYRIVSESRPIELTSAIQIAGSTGNYHRVKIGVPTQLVRNPVAGRKYQFQLIVYGTAFNSSITKFGNVFNCHFTFTPMASYMGFRFVQYSAFQEVKLKYLFPKIKAIDFLNSLAKKFNLVILPDKLNPNHLYIEPYKDWIGQGNDQNWTGKIDQSKDIQYKPTSDLQAKTILFTDDESQDNMNALYEKSSGRIYGSQLIDNSENDFSKNNDEIKTIFKPVITSYIPNTGVIGCICYSGEGNDISNEAGMRLSFYNGKGNSDIANEKLWFTDRVTSATSYTSLPKFSNYNSTTIVSQTACLTYAGENVALPLQPIGAVVPIRGTYHEYWKSFLNETYSRDARLLIAHFNLSAIDIATTNMNDVIRVEESFYRINKISNYSLVGESTCKVELIKVQATNVIDANGDECQIEPYEFTIDKDVKFINTATGVISDGTQLCCEAYDYQWDTSRSKCYAKNFKEHDITLPTIVQLSSEAFSPNMSFAGLYNISNGIDNSGSDFTFLNGISNDVKPAPKSIKINGSRNNVSGSVRNAKIDGDSNDLHPYEFMQTISGDEFSIKQKHRNVKLKGDYGFSIASNSEFESSSQINKDPYLQNPTLEAIHGKGKFITNAKLDGQTSTLVGQDGMFEVDNSSTEKRVNTEGKGFIRLPYPSLLRGEVRIMGTPRSTSWTSQYVDNTYNIEVNNQTTSLDPTTSISLSTGKSNNSVQFNNFDFDIETATAETYFDSNQNEKYINDGMFGFKIDQSSMNNLGVIDYNVEVNYSIIHNKTRQRIPFAPTQLSDCRIWLDASDPSTMTWGPVTQQDLAIWSNKGLAGGSFSAISDGTSIQYPAYVDLDGHKAIYFSYFDTLRSTNSNIIYMPNNSDTTTFVVFKMQPRTGPAPTSGELIFGTAYFGGTATWGFANDTQVNGALGYTSTTFWHQPSFSASNRYSASLNNINNTTKQVIYGISDVSASLQFIQDQNGNNASNNFGGTYVYSNMMCLGGIRNIYTASQLTMPWTGHICEVISYNRFLSPSEQTQVGNYLKKKWNT